MLMEERIAQTFQNTHNDKDGENEDDNPKGVAADDGAAGEDDDVMEEVPKLVKT